MINETVAEVKHITPHFQFVVTLDEKLIVYGDRDRIGQVLINFLTNAIKYSPQSKIIKINCGHKNNQVTIAVEDYGIGISK